MIAETCTPIALGLAMAAAFAPPNLIAPGEPAKEKHEKKGKAAETIPEPKECEDIKAGTQDSRT